MTNFTYNDGGRNEAFGETARLEFSKHGVRDCVARSLAIVTGLPYEEIWDRCACVHLKDGGSYSANHGIHSGREAFKALAAELGLVWVQPVQGPFNKLDFPARAAVSMKGHFTAVIDGVINDTYNPTPGGRAHVYGYWMPKPLGNVLYNVYSVTTGRKVNIAPLSFLSAQTMQKLMFNNYKKETTLKPNE
jgi:hypothetical protein